MHAPDSDVFSRHALQLRAHGLAVLPTNIPDKKPLIKGWRRWRWPPSEKTVVQMAQRFPYANVAILPGPSGLWIADVDSADHVKEVEKLLGQTPLRVLTSRGQHLYYRAPQNCSGLPENLRAFGLEVDLKAGNSVVIVPPSRHHNGCFYRHEDCDWGALERLPEPNFARLRGLLSKKNDDRLTYTGRVPEGWRGLTLNDLLCRDAAYVESFEELLDVGRTLNEDGCSRSLAMLR